MNNDIWVVLTQLDFTFGVCPCKDVHCSQLEEYSKRVNYYLSSIAMCPIIDRAIERFIALFTNE